MSEPESIATSVPRVMEQIQINADLREQLRVIAEVFPGTRMLWKGTWRTLTVMTPTLPDCGRDL